MIDETHDAGARSWVESANGHPDFPVQNLPFGLFSSGDAAAGPGLAIGDMILDLRAVAAAGLLTDGAASAAQAAAGGPRLNGLLALASELRRELRRTLFALLTDPSRRSAVAPMLRAASDCRMHLPAAIGDFTDFYAGVHHAEAVGALFRPENPLLPNYKHLPVGYHGRSSSICASGAPVRRPNGQTKEPDDDAPRFGPSRRLDFELELGVWIGPPSQIGEPVSIEGASEHIAGYCLLNDWSARDLQAWESRPLGPFLAKSFMTSVSPWIVTAEALAPFRTAQAERPQSDPRPLPYLWDRDDQAAGALDLSLSVGLRTASMRANGQPPERISRASSRCLYWTPAQLVAHQTSGGCNLNAGDLLGSGTISGPVRGERGSLLEMTVGGRQPLMLPNGERRTFLQDGDEVVFTAQASRPGYAAIGFGPCVGVVTPGGAGG
jgi:fumarylacetoacetase